MLVKISITEAICYQSLKEYDKCIKIYKNLKQKYIKTIKNNKIKK